MMRSFQKTILLITTMLSVTSSFAESKNWFKPNAEPVVTGAEVYVEVRNSNPFIGWDCEITVRGVHAGNNQSVSLTRNEFVAPRSVVRVAVTPTYGRFFASGSADVDCSLFR